MEDNPPLVSVAVMCYNQEDICSSAVESVFKQDYPNLEIILSDDKSTDGTFEKLKTLADGYSGPHKIILSQNPTNLGPIGHVNRLFELATGDMLAVNAGDDISRSDRISKLYNKYKINRPLLIHSLAEVIDLDGNPTGDIINRSGVARMPMRRAAKSRYLCLGATCAWNPEMMELFDPLSEHGAYGDLVFSFRARLAGRLEFVNEPLLQYRLGGLSKVGEDKTNIDSKYELTEYEKKRDQVYISVLLQRLKDVMKFQPKNIELMRVIFRTIVSFKEKHPWA